MVNIGGLIICRTRPVLFVLALAPVMVHGQIDVSNGNYGRVYDKPERRADQDGEWIVDPGVLGPDIPKVGNSLFDLVFSTEKGKGLVKSGHC